MVTLTENVEILEIPKRKTSEVQPLDKMVPIMIGGKSKKMSVMSLIRKEYYDLVAAAWGQLFSSGSKSEQQRYVKLNEILEWIDQAWKNVHMKHKNLIRDAFDEALYLESEVADPQTSS